MLPAIGRLVLSAMVVFASGAKVLADDGPGCFAKSARENLCARASAIQRDFAAKLPMALTADATLVGLTANGPTLSAVAVWSRTKADIDAYLLAGGLSMSDFDGRLSDGTAIAVCRDAPFSDFVRLGGRVKFVYRSTDGVELTALEVRDCSNRP